MLQVQGHRQSTGRMVRVERCVRVSFPPNISEGSFSEQGLLVCVQGKAVLLL